MLEKFFPLKTIVILLILFLPLLAYSCGQLHANTKGWWRALSIPPTFYLGFHYTAVTVGGVYGLLVAVYEVGHSVAYAAATLAAASAVFSYMAGTGLIGRKPLVKAIGGDNEV